MDSATANWNSSRKRVDFVLSSMTTDYDEETLRKVPNFRQLLRNPVSCSFIIVIKTLFAALYGILEEKDFQVFDHPFKILYHIIINQRKITAVLSQRSGDIPILAKTNGDHRNNFQPSLLTRPGEHAQPFAA